MQYLDDNTGDTLVVGTPEPCPDCGRNMLRMPFPTTQCSPADYAMCQPKEG